MSPTERSTSPHASADEPAWSTADLRRDPHQAADKPDRVRRMFGAIAPRYDLNNRVHSLWRDQAWRRHAVRAARVEPGQTVIDAACGTGDLAQWFARLTPAARVIGVDFTPEMLQIARAKRDRLAPAVADRIEYREGDATALDLPDASADVVSIAFGIRNVGRPDRALAEFRRVLAPGGRLVVLEFATPAIAPVRWLSAAYCGVVMPRTATLIARDRSGAYHYLPRSVGAFMGTSELSRAIEDAGLRVDSIRALTLGLCACVVAARP